MSDADLGILKVFVEAGQYTCLGFDDSGRPVAITDTGEKGVAWQENDAGEEGAEYQTRLLAHIVSVLDKVSAELMNQLAKSPQESDRISRNKTRELLRKLFPGLATVMGKGSSNTRFFQGERDSSLTAEQYVDHVLVPEAYQFHAWIVRQLPPDRRRVLDMREEVKNLSLLKMLALYNDLRNQQQSGSMDIASSRQWHELLRLFGTMYVIPGIDLAITHEQWKEFQAFWKSFSSSLSAETEIHIPIYRKGDVLRLRRRAVRVLNVDDRPFEGEELVDISVRARSMDSVWAVLESRAGRKDTGAAIFKRLRHRKLDDIFGARILVELLTDIPIIITKLSQANPDYTFQLEASSPELKRKVEKTLENKPLRPDQASKLSWTKDAPNPSSRTQILKLWAVSPSGNRFEVQIDWIRERVGSPNPGPAVERMIGSATHEEYKLGQLLIFLEQLFPVSLYGIDWQSASVQEELKKFARNKALAKVPMDIYEF